MISIYMQLNVKYSTHTHTHTHTHAHVKSTYNYIQNTNHRYQRINIQLTDVC